MVTIFLYFVAITGTDPWYVITFCKTTVLIVLNPSRNLTSWRRRRILRIDS